MRIAYLETAHDQAGLIIELKQAVEERGHDFILLVSSKRLESIYRSVCTSIVVIVSSVRPDTYAARKGYLLEKKSRFFGFAVKPYSQKYISGLISSLNIDFVLSYVGPESIKYICSGSLNKSIGTTFYFLDQIQNGYKTVTSLPYSVSGDSIGNMGHIKSHEPYVYRTPKSSIGAFSLLSYSPMRFLESVASTMNRMIKGILLRLLVRGDKRLGHNEIILAPQGFTEAAYTYGTLSLDTPIRQLKEYVMKNRQYEYRWRLHPNSATRMSWNDLYLILFGGIKVESKHIKLETSLRVCKHVVTLNSNIIYDSSIYGVESVALGNSVYHNNRIEPIKLINDDLDRYKRLEGLGSKSWNFDTFLSLVCRLEVIRRELTSKINTD